jgi:hypothetical protein
MVVTFDSLANGYQILRRIAGQLEMAEKFI